MPEIISINEFVQMTPREKQDYLNELSKSYTKIYTYPSQCKALRNLLEKVKSDSDSDVRGLGKKLSDGLESYLQAVYERLEETD